MIEAAIMRTLAKAAPNYHAVSPKFAKDTYSLCTCGKCRHCKMGTNVQRTKLERTCERVRTRLSEDGQPTGYARVDEFATCDAAQFVEEDKRELRLESENAVREICRMNATPTFNEEQGTGRF